MTPILFLFGYVSMNSILLRLLKRLPPDRPTVHVHAGEVILLNRIRIPKLLHMRHVYNYNQARYLPSSAHPSHPQGQAINDHFNDPRIATTPAPGRPCLLPFA